MHVPFVSLKTQYHNHESQIKDIVKDVFDKGIFIDGDAVRAFEKKFAAYIGVKHCITLNSGTDALILGTRALGLSTQDEIIFSSNTYYATVLSAVANGLKPVLSEVNEADYGYDIDALKKKITARTKAIMVTHLYGQSDKIDEIKSLIKKSGRKILLLEDSCQAHGAKFGSKRVGSFGTFSAFSFYPSKNLGAYGDGGAITTNDDNLALKIRQIKEYGQSSKYHHESVGFNSRLDTVQAAVLRYKLEQLDGWNRKRQDLAKLYSSILKIVPEVKIPNSYANRKSVYHLYVIRTNQRDKLQEYLKKKDINTQVHYPYPIHLQNAWKSLKYKKGDFPITEKISNEILSLPMYPELTERQVRYVCISIMNYFYQ